MSPAQVEKTSALLALRSICLRTCATQASQLVVHASFELRTERPVSFHSGERPSSFRCWGVFVSGLRL